MPLGVERFKIRANEIDFRHKITLPCLANLLQETAMHDVEAIGLPMQVLHEKNLGWVLSRMYLKVNEYPKGAEEIVVETCGHTFDKYYAYRDFRVYDKNENIICTATSSWLIFDLAKRQLISIPDFARKSVSFCTEREPLPFPKSKIPSLQNIDYQTEFQVHWHDLDMNKHVNNVIYFQWILDTLPAEILNNFRVSEFDIMFRTECLLHEKVIAQAEIVNKLAEGSQKEKEQIFLHKIIKEGNRKEVIQAEVRFIQ
jgi:acyl-ACP thioesterase